MSDRSFGTSGLSSYRPPGAVVGVALSLALLVLVLVLGAGRQRTEELRSGIEDAAEPAADLIGQIQYLLSRQSSALRGYLLTGDSVYLERYVGFRDEELGLHGSLAHLVESLPPHVGADLSALTARSADWTAHLELGEIGSAGPPASVAEAHDVLLEQELHRAALEAASGAMRSVRAWSRQQQAEIDRLERNARLIFASLSILSGLMAVGALWLTARVRALAVEAENARRRTVEAVAEREALLRGFTHDVKNPLNAADGYADLLELGHRGMLPPEQGELVARIRVGIGRAVTIIDELLEIGRLEGGGVQLSLEQVDLRALAADAVTASEAAAARRGLDLRLVEAKTGPAVVTTDAARVRHVLDNLIGNALKYTPSPGWVRVCVRTRRDTGAGQPVHVELTVSDSGPGIPPSEREAVFREFYRLASAESGYGLGLSIGRKIARLLGGDLTLDTAAGGGAAFTLRLPSE